MIGGTISGESYCDSFNYVRDSQWNRERQIVVDVIYFIQLSPYPFPVNRLFLVVPLLVFRYPVPWRDGFRVDRYKFQSLGTTKMLYTSSKSRKEGEIFLPILKTLDIFGRKKRIMDKVQT